MPTDSIEAKKNAAKETKIVKMGSNLVKSMDEVGLFYSCFHPPSKERKKAIAALLETEASKKRRSARTVPIQSHHPLQFNKNIQSLTDVS